jgi:ribosome-binding factor A
MKAVTRRIAQLEEHLQVTRDPRKRLCIVVSRVDRTPSLEDATCTRTLCHDGTLMEVVRLDQSRPGREELTDEELERWIETIPIDRLG